MGQYWLNVAVLRIVIPVTFTACVIWRPSGLSLIYLLLMLLSPLVPIPTHETMNASTGRYFKASIALCFINALLQLAFQIVLVALPRIHDEFKINCGLFEKIFRHAGLVRLEQATVWEVVYWLLPEIVALPVTIISYCLCRKFTWKSQSDPEITPRRSSPNTASKIIEDANTKIINFFGIIGTYIVLASLCLVASLNPSIEGGFYFIIFLSCATWWSCHKELQRGFAIICRIVMLVVILNITSLMAYQNQWPQEFIEINSTWSRYFALDAYYSTNCSDPRNVFSSDYSDWTNYGYSIRLFWLYFVLALQSQYLFKKPNDDDEDRNRGKLRKLDTNITQRHISIRRRTPSQRWQSARRKARLMRFGSGRTGLLQDSRGSVTVDGPHEDSIQMQSLSEEIPEDNPGPIEHIIMAVYSIFQLVVNSSYLATNIIMMTWSIMYHSWTTFIFLLWALTLWMVPNKRASMMKCSPFIVFYGTILVIGGYIYSLNLTEDELPTVFWNIQMSEIGFSKLNESNTWHLVIKSGFMTMFWITMRQYMAEIKKNKRTSALRDMAAPLHLSVSAAAATTSMQNDSVEIKSQFMKDVGKIIKKLLTKFWIVVVAIMLFTSGITGEQMTVFRIIYMSLFLIFVITFQITWSGWRKMMYMFWITVIAYSVIMLILVYTYQFNNFPQLWTKYLLIDDNLQKDIGLEKYETKDLFVRLLTPTFFVIITVLQMHYFHNDFLEETNIDKINIDTITKRENLYIAPKNIVSTLDVLLVNDGDDDDAATAAQQSTTMYTLKQLKQMSKLERIALLRRTVCQLKNFYNNIWLILEIHMEKIIYISLMLLCVNDVCAINWIFVIVIVVTMNLRKSLQIISINSIAFAIAVLMVIKMLYQIKYIKHEEWNVNCTSVNETKIYNTAEWIGMKKADPDKLFNLLNGYILIIALTTLRAVIMVRQCFYRQSRGESLDTPSVMFPNIKRSDADKGISYCLKFLLNYGFYKFGLEFCLMAIVTLIGKRLDFFSVLYGLWLLMLFAKNELQNWLYLPDPDRPPNPHILICDFFLLLMVIRQSLVFKIEEKTTTDDEHEFIAGHNYSVYQDMEKLNFINPVKDYVSHIRCWLDVLKRGFMMSFMWITLSMMFLAGTKKTNLFSLGYLIGAFVFLWQGSDFYLRPVKTILKWWNILLGYNVCVIFSKALFQGLGYVLTSQWKQSCPFIQLLGIGVGVCGDIKTDSDMVWDVLCFACLIIMKRLFKSYYFFHIVDETKAMSILASRGAELLEDLHKKRIEYQENVEKNVLEKLKFKMDKIKADQQRIQGPSYREPSTHKVDTLFPHDRPLYRRHAPDYNRQAVRSGDYYMFDDFEDEDVTDLLPDPQDEFEEEERRRQQRQRGRRMTVSELMTTLIKTDIEIATHVAMYGGTQKDALRLRRQSAPLTRKKSSVSYLSARSTSDSAAATTDADRTSLPSMEVDDIEREMKNDDMTHPGDDDDEEKSDTPKNISLLTYFKFMIEFINSAMVSATRYLNKFSRDYRYIRKVLAKEKKILKAKPDFRRGMRLGINQIWQPIPLIKERSDTEGSTDETTDGEAQNQLKEQDDSSILSRPPVINPVEEDQQPELSEVDQPPIIQLLASMWFGILAHSTFMCYFTIFIHQIKNASVLSTPLPLMVFFWGSLTVPRPSKTFWVTVIAYTEAIVIVKSIFQLEQIPWTDEIKSRPAKIIGIEKQTDYAFWDLLLLLMVFFHRYMLKALGQWTTPYNARKIIPSKITLSSSSKKNTTNTNGQSEPTRFHWQNEEHLRNDTPHSSSQDVTTTTTATVASTSHTQDKPESSGDNHQDEEKIVIKDEEIHPCDENFSTTVHYTTMKYLEPAKIFLENILSTDGKEKTNVYAYMFLCDFFNFILLIFGFSAFGTQQEDGGVTAYFQENRVPMPFLLMLLFQFTLIVIDRALYLRKSTAGKLVFQYFLIFGVHIWMFFILPIVTDKDFNTSWAPPIWYMVKCFYLLFAAYQLRLGYPTRILGNFLCKNYSMINYSLFKGFMIIPFLFELRAVMDWIWTDTSMTIMDWFKMEDIFASIYQIKCMRGVESDYPQPRGVKKSQVSKYMTGGGALFVIIGLIWFPLLIYALGGTVGDPNPPYDVSLSIKFGSHEPIYTMSSQDSEIVNYTEKDYIDLTNIYIGRKYRSSMTFLESYSAADVSAVRMSNSSRKIWGISPPDKLRLKLELEKNTTMQIHIEWSVSRQTHVKELSDTTIKTRKIEFPAYIDGKLNQDRQNLIKMLTNNSEQNNFNTTIVLQNVFPKFLKVTNQNVDPVSQLMHNDTSTTFDPDKDVFRSVTLKLSTDETQQQWWMVSEKCDDQIHSSYLSRIPLNDCESWIMMFLFNDRTFPPGLNFISGFGILGLYTTAVIVISQMMRRIVSEMAPKIMFDDMPYVDRILRLCLDIYLVRESGELCLEEDLFAKLIFLYRSPETLIRWTRPPESVASGDRAERDANDLDDDDDHDFDELTDNVRERRPKTD
ncbi:hypothetical protein HCN44_001640 [Aphidius gifuensis]|uniref:Piezo-type mechanosensitive ion channel component n=1 Tax=Aphidius gifuensis TaxID=684658 RepID=A0A835CTG7_APHGI|nr:hypothetical protein HCN44_001640 [Aphidius gifuensis]